MLYKFLSTALLLSLPKQSLMRATQTTHKVVLLSFYAPQILYKVTCRIQLLHGLIYVMKRLRVVCTEGPERVKELMAMGASSDHGEDGRLHLAREGGHSHNRIVHSAVMTGREIERALLEAVENDDTISLFVHHFAIDLLTCQV